MAADDQKTDPTSDCWFSSLVESSCFLWTLPSRERGERRVWFPNLTRVQYCICSEMIEYKWKSIGFVFCFFYTPVYAKVYVWGVTMATVPGSVPLMAEGFCHQSWWGQMMSAGPKGPLQLTWNTRLWPLLNFIELYQTLLLGRSCTYGKRFILLLLKHHTTLNTSAWLQSNKHSEHYVMLVPDSFYLHHSPR